MKTASTLAINGGQPVCSQPWPVRKAYADAEKQVVVKVMDRALEASNNISYSGPEEEGYCQEFAAFLGGGFSDGVNSGSSAVWVALRALEIEPFTEVIVPPTSDQGSFMPVVLNNCIPVPADSMPASHNTGPEQVANAITERTRAIIVAHTAGYAVDIDPIVEMAHSRGIGVIEDCAQAHGTRYKGRYVGTMGDVASFSTMFGKQHSTGSQGGVVFTTDEQMYWRMRRSADRGKPFGLPESADVRDNVIAAHNLNLDELSCAIGRAQLKRLPEYIVARRRFVEQVSAGCQAYVSTIWPEAELPESESSYWRVFFTLDIDRLAVDKETYIKALVAEGFPVQTYRYPVTEFPWYRERSVFGASGYPWTGPLYEGDPDQVYPLPNLDDADRRQFYVPIHEGCGEVEARNLVAAFVKIEAAFGKRAV